MRILNIEKRLSFITATVSVCVVALLVTGFGLLINHQLAEAAGCEGGETDCSYLSIERNPPESVYSGTEFEYTITVKSEVDINSPVIAVDDFGVYDASAKVKSVDYGGGGNRSCTWEYTSQKLIITCSGIGKDQTITIHAAAKINKPVEGEALTVTTDTTVYSPGDLPGACTSLPVAKDFPFCKAAPKPTAVFDMRLRIDKTIDGNYLSYDDLHAGEEFMYTLTITNSATDTFAQHTVSVYDQLSPHLSNVRIVKIVYYNKLMQGFDDDHNMVNAYPPICYISSQALRCSFNAMLYDSNTSGDKIIIQVAATPSAQFVEQGMTPEIYSVYNTAYVYSESDIYCKTLAKAQEELNPSNSQYLEVLGPDDITTRSRCQSFIEFRVVQPQLSITKSVSDDGRIWCYYKSSEWREGDGYDWPIDRSLSASTIDKNLANWDKTPIYDEDENIIGTKNSHILKKDVSETAYQEGSCVNQDKKFRPPNDAEIYAAWSALSLEIKTDVYGYVPNPATGDAGAQNSAAFNKFKSAYLADSTNQILISEGTPGIIVDNSVSNGETIVYTLTVTNNGSGETKGDIVITDQLDKNAFSDAGVTVQPLTGGVDCTVKDLLVRCVVSRVLWNGTEDEDGNLIPGGNQIIIRISARVEAAGVIFNTAFVGGGGDLKCPISEGGRMWCKSNEVSTNVTSPELHINKELRVDDRTCPVGGEGEQDPNDADPCWSLGTVIVNGSWAKYVIKVTNEGTANTSGMIVIHDQIPEYLEVDRTTLALKFDDVAYSYTAGFCEFRGTKNRDLYCRAYDTIEGGLLARSGVWTVEFNVRVKADVDITSDNNRVVNYAYVYGGNDAICTNETIILKVKEAFESGTNSPYNRCFDYLGSTIVSPKLSVKKAISNGQVQAGQPFKYTITVDNIGDHEIPYGTTVVDTLPTGIVIDTAAIPPGCEYDEATRNVTCYINENIQKNRPAIFELTALTTNATGTITNKVLAYNRWDKDCPTLLAANYTKRCHDTASAQSMAPVMKINIYTNVLDTFVGGQVEYRIVTKNVGNMPSTETTTVKHAISPELRILGIRAQKGVCWPSLTEITCEIPAGVKAGETVNISVLTQVRAQSDAIESTVDLFGGGDAVCTVDGNTGGSALSKLFTTPVFAADDEPLDVDGGSDSTGGDSTNTGGNDGSGDITLPEPAPPTTTEPTRAKRNERCQDSVVIRASASPYDGILGINDTGLSSPAAGALSMLQALGTVSLLGAASYGLLKFGFVATPVK